MRGMGWEIDSEREYKCPCGGGTYTVVLSSNDWGSSRESWQMNCPRCAGTHRLDEFTYREGDRQYVGQQWVEREAS